jgi:hypothetical protein
MSPDGNWNEILRSIWAVELVKRYEENDLAQPVSFYVPAA